MKDPVGQGLTLAPLAAALARSGDLPAARRVVSKIAGSFRVVGADYVMQYQVKVGDIAGAQEMAASFRQTPDKDWALWKLAAALADAHKWKLADEVLGRLSDVKWRSMALRDVAGAKAKFGDIVGALSMVRQIPYGSDRVAIHVAVAVYQYQHQRVEEAKRTLKNAMAEAVNVPEDWGRTQAYINVVEGHMRIGDIVSALAILDQALADRRRISDGFYKAVSLNEVAEAFAKIGDTDRAISLAESEPAGKDRDRAYRSIAPAVAELNGPKAVKTVQDIGDRVTRFNALRAVARVQARQGRFADAVRTSKLIVNDRLRLDSTCAGIATIEARSGRPEDALKLIRSIRSSIVRAEPLAAACKSLARSGKTQRALEAATHASSMEERTQALVGVAEGIMDREGRPAVLRPDAS
jgi:tetratricopeptide (TPR) repeat protein